MKFIGRLADGLWVSGQTQGFDLYTGWIDLQLENLGFEKQVWVDLTFIQAMLGQETTHRVSIPAVYKKRFLITKNVGAAIPRSSLRSWNTRASSI